MIALSKTGQKSDGFAQRKTVCNPLFIPYKLGNPR